MDALRAAVGYLNQIARAIDVIHNADQVQGYITPSNILIDTHRNRALLIDVGLGELLDSLNEDILTAAVHPAFRSTEQLRGEPVAKQSDVYCLGAVLYYMLTGRPPFLASNDEEIRRQALRYEPVAPHLLNPHIDRKLSKLCMRCLSKSPQRRFASAKSLTGALSAWASRPDEAPSTLLRLWDRWSSWLGELLALLLSGCFLWSKFSG